jgi:hypothetical protein
MPLITPLWGLPPATMLGALLDVGITARISCVALPKFAAPATQAWAQSPPQPQQQGEGEEPQQQGALAGGGACSACHCHCAPLQAAPLGPPLFDAVGQLLGRPITRALVDGPLAEAAAAAGVNACGEDGSFHSCVTACPLMGPRRVELAGAPHTDDASGYAYMVWDRVAVTDASGVAKQPAPARPCEAAAVAV